MEEMLDFGETVYHKATQMKGIVRYRVIYPSNYIEYGVFWETETMGNHPILELMDKDEMEAMRIIEGE